MSARRVIFCGYTGRDVAGTVTDSNGHLARVVGDNECIYWMYESALRDLPAETTEAEEGEQ